MVTFAETIATNVAVVNDRKWRFSSKRGIPPTEIRKEAERELKETKEANLIERKAERASKETREANLIERRVEQEVIAATMKATEKITQMSRLGLEAHENVSNSEDKRSEDRRSEDELRSERQMKLTPPEDVEGDLVGTWEREGFTLKPLKIESSRQTTMENEVEQKDKVYQVEKHEVKVTTSTNAQERTATEESKKNRDGESQVELEAELRMAMNKDKDRSVKTEINVSTEVGVIQVPEEGGGWEEEEREGEQHKIRKMETEVDSTMEEKGLMIQDDSREDEKQTDAIRKTRTVQLKEVYDANRTVEVLDEDELKIEERKRKLAEAEAARLRAERKERSRRIDELIKRQEAWQMASVHTNGINNGDNSLQQSTRGRQLGRSSERLKDEAMVVAGEFDLEKEWTIDSREAEDRDFAVKYGKPDGDTVVIDISCLMIEYYSTSCTEKEIEIIAKQWNLAFKSSGFALITGHGIRPDLFTELGIDNNSLSFLWLIFVSWS